MFSQRLCPSAAVKEPSGFFSHLSGRAHPTRRNQDELYHFPPKPVNSAEIVKSNGSAKKKSGHRPHSPSAWRTLRLAASKGTPIISPRDMPNQDGHGVHLPVGFGSLAFMAFLELSSCVYRIYRIEASCIASKHPISCQKTKIIPGPVSTVEARRCDCPMDRMILSHAQDMPPIGLKCTRRRQRIGEALRWT